MTEPHNLRRAVYLGAAAFLLWPVLILTLTWIWARSTSTFILCTVFLCFFVAIGRWDIVGYGLKYILLVAMLILAYRREGWLLLALSLGCLLVVELFFRQSGRGTPLELSFPLNHGTYYVAHGGCFRQINHHRVSQSQKYALDIVRLNAFGKRASDIYPRQLQRYKIFGDEVYSPCAGTVTCVMNDLPDLLPGEMDRKNIAGNHIVIRCDGAELYVGVAHLMQGSVLVKAGDHVGVWQPLARVGNSGNSSEPHLHIHAKRGGLPESMLDGEGIPMRLGGRWLIRNSLVRRRSRGN